MSCTQTQLDSARRWRDKNPEKIKADRRKRSTESREYHRLWASENKEKMRGYFRAYREKNIVKLAGAMKQWRSKNRERIRASHTAYLRVKRIVDVNYRLSEGMRNRIKAAVKRNGGSKAFKTTELLGCPVNFLRGYLSVFFKLGMTWENYGKVWHIDHKRPCSSFDLSDPAQQKKCFHWTNLQPLSALENLQKGDTYVSG